jgi:predicted metal-dependent phosphoesterase TrpH
MLVRVSQKRPAVDLDERPAGLDGAAGADGRRWLKAEMHAHCSLDPVDYRLCRHTPVELVEHASRLGYDVLAITCHNLDVWTAELSEYARRLGVVLIPGMEVEAEGKRHVLLYNFRTGASNLDTVAKIRERKRADTLVVAPHPYFPGGTCIGPYLEPNIDVFDAVEVSGFHAPGLDFNRRARKVAGRHRKPLVGNGDVHYLWQLGRTCSWIYAEPELGSVLSAVKQGLTRVESSALSWREVAGFWATTLWRQNFPVRPAPIGDGIGVILPEGA